MVVFFQWRKNCRERTFFVAGENGTVAFMPSGMHVSQYPRIFISPQGSVSPLHFDTSSSFLVQIRGRKRLLFYSPKNLDRLYTYGGLHILRRRSRVDPCNPDFKKYPKFKDIAAHEAILEPGDVLWFPGQSFDPFHLPLHANTYFRLRITNSRELELCVLCSSVETTSLKTSERCFSGKWLICALKLLCLCKSLVCLIRGDFDCIQFFLSHYGESHVLNCFSCFLQNLKRHQWQFLRSDSCLTPE